MKNRNSQFSFASTLIAAAALAACGGGGSDAPPATGTLRLLTANTQTCGFDEINVTVNKIRVHASESAAEDASGWVDIAVTPARKINLLSLNNGAFDVTALGNVAPGQYKQVRVVLDANGSAGTANSVKPVGGVETTLETPATLQGGIAVNSTIDVAAGARSDVIVAFDACKSVLVKGTGQYALSPVVTVLPNELNAVSGFLSTGLSGSNVIVSAQQAGKVVRSTKPVGNEFVFSRLVPGNYDIVITADGRATSVIAAVPVANTTSFTMLSTAAAPILMPTSTMRSIGGTVTLSPAGTAATYVAVKQTVGAGVSLVVKQQAVNLSTRTYAFANLPVTAPQLATYSATSPLVFAASTSSVLPGAGKYVVEASAPGYATKSLPSVDITAASQANANLVLVP